MRKKIKIFFPLMLLFLILQDAWAMWEENEGEDISSRGSKLQQTQLKEKYERSLQHSLQEDNPEQKRTPPSLAIFPISSHQEKGLSNLEITLKDLLYKGYKAGADSEEPIIMYCHREIKANDLTSSFLWKFQIKRHNTPKKVLDEIRIGYRKESKKIFFKEMSLDYIYNQSFNAQLRDHCLREKLYTFSEMTAALSHSFISFNEKDLVIFDIDDTLVWFLDPFYIEHVLKNSPLFQKCLESKNNVLCDRSACINMTIAPCAVIESHSPQLISTLQNQGIKAIALTAQPALIFQEESELINVPKWRVKHLKEREIDFSKSFSQIPPLSWQCEMNNDEDTPGPYFEKGVLFAGVVGKPNALLNLLRTISFKPKKVLFIDDRLENVLSVYRTLTQLGIQCFSVLYTRANKFSVVNEFSAEEFDAHLKYQEEFLMKRL